MAFLRTSLKANFFKNREWEDNREISDFFIFCSIYLYSEFFSKIPFQGSEALYFSFQIEESSKIAILATNCYVKWHKIVHFLFARKDKQEHFYQSTLDIL